MRSVIIAALGSAAALVVTAGCHSHSHTSVRTYEYGHAEEPPPSAQLGSEYQMQAPGEMQSPGAMITDPD